VTATGVSATISTTDTDINIIDPFEYYHDILTGDAAWCVNDFDIEIAASCPEKDVLFTISMEADQGAWTDTFIIHISEQGTPILSFVSFVIDDDSDGNSSGNNNSLAEPGEHIELPILLENLGDANAHNVTAVLSSSDPDISIVDANENYGNIDAGTSDWSNNEFDFNVSSNCPDKDVLFTLDIYSDEGTWTANFIVHIHITGSPNIVYANHVIDDDNDGTSSGDGDGNPEPGENIEMPLALFNTGTAAAHLVVAHISCSDPDISITDDAENFATIFPAQEMWSNLDFDFTVGYGTPEKDVVFNLTIQSDEGVWNDSFIVHIYPASGNPALQYVSHIIDDDDNGASNGNGDGIPSAGEQIEMPVLIANTGDAVAHHVTAVLSSSDPDINITDANESYPDIIVGETAWSNYAFDFEISPTCPDKTVVFTITIFSDEGSWTSNFSVPIIGAGVPHLVFTEYIIDDDNSGESSGDGDGLAEPGEHIELPILISNIGNGTVHSVVGEIATSDPDITIVDYYEQFGDITEGSQAWTYNDFDFEISPTCPEKDVLFTLSLEGDEGVWVLYFTIHITPHVYYNLTTTANPALAGITYGDGSFIEGETVTVSAEANEGYSFINWTKDGNIVSGFIDYSFIIDENTELVANFQIEEFTVTLNANPVNGGTVSGGGIYQYGETATIIASPNADYNFASWTLDGEVVSINTSYSFVVTESVSLTANFQGEQYIISVSASPSNGGTVTGNGEYDYGDMATVTASPINNFDFVNWTENGTVVSYDAIYTFEVTSNRTLVAVFSEEYYTINAISVPTGGGEIEGAGNYSYGQYASMQTTPSGGFYFIDWKENGTTVSTNTTYYFQVTHDRSLEAHFGVYAYEITVTANPENAGTVSGAGNFNYGDEVTVLAESNEGWEFLSWTNNGSVMSNEAEYT
ncbi:MAG: hypothetical protein GQ527_12860, partial [Bacteroidales bacterium]|nr:hypothetical protein [Bacteroidales bacterium]